MAPPWPSSAWTSAKRNQGKDIKLSFSVGNDFSFSLDTRGGKAPVMGKKPESPSTLKRNAERRQAFLAKKNAQVPLSHVIQADLATNQQVIEKGSYQCDQCDAAFKTSNGLKIHVGKSHKESLSSPEKLREIADQFPSSQQKRGKLSKL